MARPKKIIKFATNAMLYIVMADLNRIKVVLEIDVRELINKSKE